MRNNTLIALLVVLQISSVAYARYTFNYEIDTENNEAIKKFKQLFTLLRLNQEVSNFKALKQDINEECPLVLVFGISNLGIIKDNSEQDPDFVIKLLPFDEGEEDQEYIICKDLNQIILRINLPTDEDVNITAERTKKALSQLLLKNKKYNQ